MKIPRKSPGVYARIMGDFHTHEKVLVLSAEAIGIWTLVVSWSVCRRRDGVFSEGQLRGIAGARPYKKALSELLAVGLVDRIEGGDFCLHDWTEHNMSRSEHEDLKAADRARKAEMRASKRVGKGGEVQRDNVRTFPGVRHPSDRSPDDVS